MTRSLRHATTGLALLLSVLIAQRTVPDTWRQPPRRRHREDLPWRDRNRHPLTDDEIDTLFEHGLERLLMVPGITFLGSAQGATGLTSLTVSAITPAANSLLVACCHAQAPGVGPYTRAFTFSNTHSGGGAWAAEVQQYTQVANAIWTSVSWAVQGATPGSGDVTVTPSDVIAHSIFAVLEITGFNTSAPVAQSKPGEVASANPTLSIVLDAAPAADSLVLGFGTWRRGSTNMANPAVGPSGNYTEAYELRQANSASAITVGQAQATTSGQAVSQTCAWTQVNNCMAANGVVLEIAAPSSGYTTVAEPGSIAISGTDATLTHTTGYRTAADPGAIVITGTAATFRLDRRTNADPGSVLITGTAIGVTRTFHADAGSILITGTAATLSLSATYTTQLDPGALVITGTDATLTHVTTGYTTTAEPGAVAITGTAAGLRLDRVLVADPGAVLITGTAAGLFAGKRIAADAGSIAITGTAAALLLHRYLGADAGAVAITGTDALLTWSGAAVVPPSFIGTPGARTLTATPGARSLVGTPRR